MKLSLTTYEILHILSISLTSKTHLLDLLDKTNFQNNKECFDSSEPLLFDLNFNRLFLVDSSDLWHIYTMLKVAVG